MFWCVCVYVLLVVVCVWLSSFMKPPLLQQLQLSSCTTGTSASILQLHHVGATLFKTCFCNNLFSSTSGSRSTEDVPISTGQTNEGAMFFTKEGFPCQVHADFNKVNKFRRGIHGTMLYTLMMINSYIWPDSWWSLLLDTLHTYKFQFYVCWITLCVCGLQANLAKRQTERFLCWSCKGQLQKSAKLRYAADKLTFHRQSRVVVDRCSLDPICLHSWLDTIEKCGEHNAQIWRIDTQKSCGKERHRTQGIRTWRRTTQRSSATTTTTPGSVFRQLHEDKDWGPLQQHRRSSGPQPTSSIEGGCGGCCIQRSTLVFR